MDRNEHDTRPITITGRPGRGSSVRRLLPRVDGVPMMDITLNHPFELSSLRFEEDAKVVELVPTEEMHAAWQQLLLDSARELERSTPDA